MVAPDTKAGRDGLGAGLVAALLLTGSVASGGVGRGRSAVAGLVGGAGARDGGLLAEGTPTGRFGSGGTGASVTNCGPAR